MKFYIKNFFSKFGQIRRKFCAVFTVVMLVLLIYVLEGNHLNFWNKWCTFVGDRFD